MFEDPSPGTASRKGKGEVERDPPLAKSPVPPSTQSGCEEEAGTEEVKVFVGPKSKPKTDVETPSESPSVSTSVPTPTSTWKKMEGRTTRFEVQKVEKVKKKEEE